MIASGVDAAVAATKTNAASINGTFSDSSRIRACNSPSRSSASARRDRSCRPPFRRQRSSCKRGPAPAWPFSCCEYPRPSNLLRVDLCALHRAGVINVDRFPFAEHIDAHYPRLPMPVTGLLRAAEGQMHFRADGGRVDVEDAGVHVAHGNEGVIDVAGIDR